MKVRCFKCFISVDSSDEQSAFAGLKIIIICSFISFLSLQLNEILQSEIKQKLSSGQKITAITYKKLISAFCVFGVLYSPPRSICCSNKIVSSA